MSDLTKEDRQHFARELLQNPLLTEILAKLEADAVSIAVAARPDDHLAHQAQISYVRAIRDFTADLKANARDTQPVKAAPA